MSRPIRVLVVEDDRAQRELLASALRRTGDLELAGTAADGREGLRLARELEFDVLVLDLVLPGLDGLELLRRYRKEGGRAGVLVLTAAGGTHVAGTALALGADYVLLKPAAWPAVAARIRQLEGGLARSCEALLLELGAKERWAGTVQAARCAGWLGERRGTQLKELYLDAAALDRCTPEAVEKNIRMLIARLQRQSSPLFVLTFGDGGLTNGEFLRRLSEAALGTR